MAQHNCRTCDRSLPYSGKGRPRTVCDTAECKSTSKPRECIRCGVAFRPIGPGRYYYCEQCGTCAIDGCENDRTCGDWCGTHAMRVYRTGQPGTAARLPNNPKAGQGTVDQAGYRRHTIGGHAYMEHRLVMERMIGRPLDPQENVHHRNGIKLDNSPANLELWVRSQPYGQRVTDLVSWIVANHRGLVQAEMERTDGGDRVRDGDGGGGAAHGAGGGALVGG